ncbi:hypothetical protein FRC10_000827 [Ceratobasidium sp. 414]|nr:hypothetical protein FRC10_000827 [Ceratobasidium sp. 414]
MSSPRALTREEQQELIAAAVQAKKAAYNPYSKFRVGAALLTPDGRIITGANIENASYGKSTGSSGTICAERTALVKAVSEGDKKFLAIAVTSYVSSSRHPPPNPTAIYSDVRAPISPCGICRQFIREFCSLSTPIIMASSNYTPETASETVKVLTLEEILPYSFGPEDLERPRDA